MKKLHLIALTLIIVLVACRNTENSNTSNNQTVSENSSNMKYNKIMPCLWIDQDAKAAVDYYLSIFKNGKLIEYNKYEHPQEAAEISGQSSFETAIMEIGDIQFQILAAGPYFKFNEAVSFVINCKDQAEVDYFWEALTSNGGQESQCGWCKDKYGLSWQVVPEEYYALINSPDSAVREKAMKNTLKMKKIILSELT